MRLHPRTMQVQQAEVDLHGWLIDWQRNHDLTWLEALACLHAAAARITKYALRAERHPDDPSPRCCVEGCNCGTRHRADIREELTT